MTDEPIFTEYHITATEVSDQTNALMMGIHSAVDGWLKDMPPGRKETYIAYLAFAVAGRVLLNRTNYTIGPIVEAMPHVEGWLDGIAKAMVDAMRPVNEDLVVPSKRQVFDA